MRLEKGKVKHPFDGETLYCNQTFTVLKVNESYLEGGEIDLYVCKMHKLDNKKEGTDVQFVWAENVQYVIMAP